MEVKEKGVYDKCEGYNNIKRREMGKKFWIKKIERVVVSVVSLIEKRKKGIVG